ncbi:tetratricopeptide repeat protein [Streptomyces iranensis]|uniref:Tetratricopeptide (TPR) repeat protein n=1 Tax=Streptomyces iranensis TaxID=576784 RepID=A0ABS4N2D2_9ACTN|nr:hypothetical protein [Streptomyces iranensis]MBP2066147.1 tetratricopeptide (TPR) repeat protein [Streptomyces iranensis]
MDTENFLSWLYRPFIDLGVWEADGNPLTLGAHLASRALYENDGSYPRLHGSIMPSSREVIVKTAGAMRYLVKDPRELGSEWRTPEWQGLCDHLDAYSGLDSGARLRSLWLLHRMGLHAVILKCEVSVRPSASDEGISEDDAALLYMRGLAKVILFYDGQTSLDTSELEQVVAYGRPGCWGHVEATYLLAQLSIKSLDDIDGFRHYVREHKKSIGAVDSEGQEQYKLLSRYHRIGAFLPQLAGDHASMSREMDQAEHYCRLLYDADLGNRDDWQILRYGVLESRTKENLLCEDIEAAEQYAVDLVSHAPASPQARCTLGQVCIEKGDLDGAVESYRWASVLGPQVRHISEFMVGQCMEAQKRLPEACAAYFRSVESDPLAISSVRRLRDVAAVARNSLLTTWADTRLRSLSALSKGSQEDLLAYQKYGGILGKS